MDKFVVSLCDRTGHFVEPWVTFGYKALLVDPQHEDFGEGPILKFPGTILEALPLISRLIRAGQVAFVMGFPPCTDVSLSGTRHWKDKYQNDPYFQAKAAIVAEQCRMVGELAGCPWAFENPKSAFTSIFGPPCYTFQPYEYLSYEPDDNYNKETWLWTGGGFVMPPTRAPGHLGEPDQRIHLAPPGPDRANFRSMTPRGFSIACFLANAEEFKQS